MKTHGICHAQSARKHRKAGHVVQELGDGRRYRWAWVGFASVHAASIVRNGRFGKLNGMKATHIIVDEHHSFDDVVKLSGKMVEIPIENRQMQAYAAGAIHTPQRIELLVEGVGSVTIAVGDSYWPKRRNQHSKPYRVMGFMAGTGDVMFDRGFGTPMDSTAPRAFYGLIGKRA